jgi:alpha-amylase
LLRGGHWRHFLVKYPESNRMHKMALALSLLCRDRGDPVDVRQAIGRAQCNDAYWHGVFGGFYLAFLRGAVWHNLARAESLLRHDEPLAIELRDVDADSHDEIWIHSAHVSVLAAPARGGMIDTWLDLSTHQNLLNTVARHREAYHEPLGTPDRPHEAEANDAGAPSIHDLESQLTEIPPIDHVPRGLFVDRIVAVDATRDDFVQGRLAILHSWSGQAMTAAPTIVEETAIIHFAGGELNKAMRIDRSAVACEWRWDPHRFPADAWFTTELSYSANLTIEAPGAERWDYEIETMAKSEKGFERATQGRATVLRWLAGSGMASVRVSVAR